MLCSSAAGCAHDVSSGPVLSRLRAERCTTFGGTRVPGWGIAQNPTLHPMELGFETIGNATVVVHDDGVPVLATDPWVRGSAYFGSWGLSHAVPPPPGGV